MDSKDEQNSKRVLIQELIKELEAALNYNDFKKTVDDIKKLQHKWKKIGHAGKHLEQKLWHSFRSKCDEFFENKGLRKINRNP